MIFVVKSDKGISIGHIWTSATPILVEMIDHPVGKNVDKINFVFFKIML